MVPHSERVEGSIHWALSAGEKTTVVDFSPKAITTNELYGSVNMARSLKCVGVRTQRDVDLRTFLAPCS